MRSRQTNDQSPMCTINTVGPLPTSWYAIGAPSTSIVCARWGQLSTVDLASGISVILLIARAAASAAVEAVSPCPTTHLRYDSHAASGAILNVASLFIMHPE